ncbi:cysteine protease atg4 [Aspergillus steynii IBT 23096]|uniref:Cysteine protease n=1 Tax=Aspergillus steynii IBT 23096 TaxID=1392250 RepID=A0A2I2GFU7_9EURO|nr:cysteine protease atg4 [Aspergillus steynii IBT 23096]PLB51764.1 cysteine protease atg4 [Aspergillus steynii IBT 23096]
MNNVDIGRCGKRIVQYLWDPEPQNDEEPDAMIWCLGTTYPPGQEYILPQPKSNLDRPNQPKSAPQDTTYGWPEGFLLDFESRIWMTYRSNFPPIPKIDSPDARPGMTLSVRLRSQLMEPEGFTSDTGWGCMIRSGQSLLANALSILHLGREWRRGHKTDQVQLLKLFADHPDAPLSIHRFVEHGAQACGKYPGQWFGPSATAKCIEFLSAQCEGLKLKVYVSNESSDIHEDSLMKVARDVSGAFQPTLILMGTRLGIDHITPIYWDALRTSLQLPQSVGIAGGRPAASHYFVGVQGSNFFYLDPHSTRPAVPHHEENVPYSKDEIATYHCRRLRRIHVTDMDPSMLIGFLIKNEEDWVNLKNRVASVQGKPIVRVIAGLKPDIYHGRQEALDEVESLDDAE